MGLADVTVPLHEDAAADQPALPRGSSFSRYLILDRVGEGGVGEVYAAYDPHLDRRIALKILRAGPGRDNATRSDDDVQWRKLVREAKALAKLNDPHVVTVHDVAAWEGRTFLAMELVDGIDLGAWLARRPTDQAQRAVRTDRVGSRTRPDPREVLRVLVDAGRGLAAAHTAGVIHRDFKPANVLIGNDGRVKVGDFGLARLHDDATSEALRDRSRVDRTREVPSAPDDVDATDSGHSQIAGIAGTPNYMAPELFAGRSADVRSDVYAFCVTLHEALFGERPFTAATITALVAAKEQGPGEPTSRRGVPRALVRAVMRGLSARPEERWPDMASLLAAIDRVPGKGLVRVLPLGGLVVVGATALALARPAAATCGGADRHLAGVWDDAARARVETALVASGRSFADSAAVDVDGALASWSARWVAAHEHVCEASEHGEQSASALDVRMACLQSARAELVAVVDVLASMDPNEVDRAAAAAHGLPTPEPCTTLQPSTDATGPESEALRERLARAAVLLRAGRNEQARTLALEIEADARDEPRIAAEATVLAARGIAALGDYEAAERALEGALFAAQALGHPRAQADAALALAHMLATRTPRFPEALRWTSYAEAEARRAELDSELVARVLDTRGVALHGRGDHEAAIAAYEEALAVLDDAGADELARCGPLDNLGAALRSAGRYPLAIETHERALAIRERILGPDHPDVARSLSNLGSALMEDGRSREAVDLQMRSLEIRERAFGPDHPDVATSLTNLAGSQYHLGRYADSEASARRALAIRERVHGRDHQQTASSLGTLGLALHSQAETTEAAEVLRRALVILERDLGDGHPRTASARSNLANALMDAGELEAAAALYRKAIATAEETDGVEHPDVAVYLTNLGNVLIELGELGEAQQVLERALAIRERALGADHPDLVFTLMSLGGVHLTAKRAGEAVPLLERALVIVDRGQNEPLSAAAVRFELAQALALSRGDRARAGRLVDEAEGMYRDVGPGGERYLVQLAEWRRANR